MFQYQWLRTTRRFIVGDYKRGMFRTIMEFSWGVDYCRRRFQKILNF